MKKVKTPTEKEWKRLYDLAVKLKELAPWDWMYEIDVFGVRNPETGEIGFVSVMGNAGEHFGISVYLGAEALFAFEDLHYSAFGDAADLETNPFALFEIPQLQVSFEDREFLEKEDHALIKKLGLKFRGSHNYPLFRSILPGFLPYFITSDEARFLSYAIEQTLEVAPRVEEDDSILDDTEIDENYESYLVRVPEKQNGKIVWHDEHQVIEPPPEHDISVLVPEEVMEEIQSFPQNKKLIIEIDFFYTPTPVAEKGKRPYFPRMLMFADGRKGIILGIELLKALESEVENFTQLVANIFESLKKLGVRPGKILVASEELFYIFSELTQHLNIKLEQVDELPAIEAAKTEMIGFLGGSMF